jgi:hypothetical protein
LNLAAVAKLVRRPTAARLQERASFQGKTGREINKVPDLLRRRICRKRDVVSATGMPDENVVRAQHIQDCGTAAFQRRWLVTASPMPRQVDRNCVVTQRSELRNDTTPTPCAVKSAVDQNKPHSYTSPITLRFFQEAPQG